MSEKILIAFISAGLATLVNSIFQIVNKLIDLKQIKKTKEAQEAELYQEKKEQVYIGALDHLLQIRRGFDYTSENIKSNKQLKEMIDKQNQAFIALAPKLRLYAPDNIFNQYQNLVIWGNFAYASPHGPRLSEDCKQAYNMLITLLARRMQEDLGYRKYNHACDIIQCPNCGTKHDIIGTCPKCNMTFEQLQIKAQEIVTQAPKNMNDIES